MDARAQLSERCSARLRNERGSSLVDFHRHDRDRQVRRQTREQMGGRGAPLAAGAEARCAFVRYTEASDRRKFSFLAEVAERQTR